jgi:hypothetical protein
MKELSLQPSSSHGTICPAPSARSQGYQEETDIYITPPRINPECVPQCSTFMVISEVEYTGLRAIPRLGCFPDGRTAVTGCEQHVNILNCRASKYTQRLNSTGKMLLVLLQLRKYTPSRATYEG